MRLFIHDTPIYFISPTQRHRLSGIQFDVLLVSTELIFNHPGHVFVEGFSVQETAQILIDYSMKGPTNPPLSVTWVLDDRSTLKTILKSHFEYIEAAGGIVMQSDRFLLIHRLGKWDLPKGKIEAGEKPKKAARREVEEECGVVGQVGKKIGHTWHTYTYQGKPVLKKTYWYLLTSQNQHGLRPQREEDITEVAWCTALEANHRLANSYASIQSIWQKAQKYLKTLDMGDNR